VSAIYNAMARDLYPKWFKDYGDVETTRQTRIFEKGHIIEEAWGNALGEMIPSFKTPEPIQVDGVWMSADGLCADSIHECKATNKSCRDYGNPGEYILLDKYWTWLTQAKAYCYGYGRTVSKHYIWHLQGDYKGRPPEPMARVHTFTWTQEELEQNWKNLMDYAQEKGMFDASCD